MENQKFEEESTEQVEEVKTAEARELADKLSKAGWGLFFIWVGIAFLANFDTGVGLLGIGIITLGGQAARRCFNLRLESFWVVVGLLFVVGGLWELFETELSLGPILLIVAGLALLFSVVKRKPPVKE